MPIKRIAGRLSVSPSSVFHWTRDIELTPEQIDYNLRRAQGASEPRTGREARGNLTAGLP